MFTLMPVTTLRARRSGCPAMGAKPARATHRARRRRRSSATNSPLSRRARAGQVVLAQVQPSAHDVSAVVGHAPACVCAILAIRPQACRRRKHRLTLALAFFGSSAHERSIRIDVSRARMSRLVNPWRQCSPAIRLLNSVASFCANGLRPGRGRACARPSAGGRPGPSAVRAEPRGKDGPRLSSSWWPGAVALACTAWGRPPRPGHRGNDVGGVLALHGPRTW